jgi:uncharacterized membrane protein YhaH (DUF805 family)
MNWYLQVLKKYTTFSGRARRQEYWMFVLFNVIFRLVAFGLDNVLGTCFNVCGHNVGYGWFYLIYNLAIIIPGIAVCIRRLHDVGKSGWFYLIGLIPLIGAIWLLVLFCTEGQPGDNKYGADPKQDVA